MLTAAGIGFSYHRWKPVPVFRDLDWMVTPGATTLLLGRNGAGKSTLLKLLAGQVTPSVGTVAFGGDSAREALYRNVGWMPQTASAARGFTAREQLEFAAWIAGCGRREARRRAAEALEMVDLTPKAEVRSSALSGGQLRRLCLGQAWVRGGEVLLLDEPTAGLDPAQTRGFRAALAAFDFPGGVVISTHQVAELDGQVDRVTVLDGGEIVADGTRDDFVRHGRRLGVTSSDLAEVFAATVGGEDQ
ncbi:ATP-binding cassette domain-containing protein [Marmoricola sp. RAF53]|uniref:ATP-binding cassette domain-containing protein n=1 Tax=Marmoricola sp. RAF53 TaxID=3233059 RepID=UPI003F9A4C56